MFERSTVSVDIIMPFKDNPEHLLLIEEWIDRVEIPKQFRIILVHDISLKNECESGVKKLKFKFELGKFIIIQGMFGSPGASRNAGLEHAVADWIVFWDSDDVPNPGKFLDMILLGNEKGAKVCIGSFELKSFTKNGEVLRYLSSHPLYVALSPGIWRMAFHSSLIKGVRFSSALLGEDQRFLFEINFLRGPVFYYNQAVYTYHKGIMNQLTANKKNLSDLVDTLSFCLNFVKETFAKRNIFIYSIMILRMVGTIIKHKTAREIRLVFILLLRVYFGSPKKLVFGLIPSLAIIPSLILMRLVLEK